MTAIAQKKQRINLSPSDGDLQFIKFIANRENIPVAKKTMELVQTALIIEEDKYFALLAEKRMKKGGKTFSLEELEKELFSS